MFIEAHSKYGYQWVKVFQAMQAMGCTRSYHAVKEYGTQYRRKEGLQPKKIRKW